ncbi:MAG: hypothetical protein IAA89_00270 [Firmicutes bacterium]|uniref:Uncharacterized protein n=1 Tax=Candidatus Gallilactobacillus intestinavium TaxID=2840838 RepID=A0A9D9E3S3_9LACO|nr:hypothetical protein [Candidatus Gallilactobacillus intestinavium]
MVLNSEYLVFETDNNKDKINYVYDPKKRKYVFVANNFWQWISHYWIIIPIIIVLLFKAL